MLLTQSAPRETVAIEEDRLRSIFGHGLHALDERARREARQFAEEHNCDFLFDEGSRYGRFTKRDSVPSSPARAI